MKGASPQFVFPLLMAAAYTLGTVVHLRAVGRAEADRPDEGAFKKLLGDGRRLFAGQFVEMADVYFHSGRYPSIFDRAMAAQVPKAVTSAVHESATADDHEDHDHAGEDHSDHQHSHAGHHHDANGKCLEDQEDEAHLQAMTPGTAGTWLETFIQRFRITEHTHLEEGNEREILPWLRVAIELDPQAIETYTTAAYWLRKKLHKVDQAERVLREGIRNNPINSELWFELGRLYGENQRDVVRARNIWRHGLKCWQEEHAGPAQLAAISPADKLVLARIASSLGELEATAGDLPQAIEYFQLASQYSPEPEGLLRRIEQLKARSPKP